MALPSGVAGYEVALYLGTDTPTPTYVFLGGIDTTEINGERGVIERAIRDLSTPTGAPTMVRRPGLKMSSISGSGMYVAAFAADIEAAFNAGTSRWWRVVAQGVGAWTGKFVMPSRNISGPANGNDYAEISISLQSDGDTTFVPA